MTNQELIEFDEYLQLEAEANGITKAEAWEQEVEAAKKLLENPLNAEQLCEMAKKTRARAFIIGVTAHMREDDEHEYPTLDEEFL